MGLILRAEHRVHVLNGGVVDGHEVAGDGLNGLGFFFLNRQHGRDADGAVGRRADVDIAQERIIHQIRWVILDGRVGAVEHNIGQHAEEAHVIRAVYHHVAPDRQFFNRLVAV
jgi:hypothetical protein